MNNVKLSSFIIPELADNTQDGYTESLKTGIKFRKDETYMAFTKEEHTKIRQTTVTSFKTVWRTQVRQYKMSQHIQT